MEDTDLKNGQWVTENDELCNQKKGKSLAEGTESEGDATGHMSEQVPY